MAVFARNVTIDPTAPASAVSQPEIDEVIDLVRGDILESAALITSHRYDALIEKRVAIGEAVKGDQPLFACALCGTPVYIASSPEKRFFFRHKVENGSCPAQTRGLLGEAEIRARKYHGLRESEAHKRIKGLIERSLAADPLFKAESIHQERRWRSEHDPAQWRQPDVQAICDGQWIAFEAQLSTTFLDVVVERRMFYRKEGALLIWIVGHFDPEYRRLTMDDLLFSNNSNIMVVDDETTRISEERGAFHLRCHYRQVSRDGPGIYERWDQRTISFHELTWDIQRQQAYLIDCKSTKERLADEVDQELRAAFFDVWKSVQFPYDTRPDILERWRETRAKLAARGIAIPEAPHADSSFRAMMHGLLSVQAGTPVGWEFTSLIQVAHHLAEDYPQHLLAFGYGLDLYGRKALLETQDTSGKWKIKCSKFRPKIKARDPAYRPDEESLASLTFLFPEIGRRVSAHFEKI
jgi:hypothetical protein